MKNIDIIENELFKIEFEDIITKKELKYNRDGIFYDENYNNVLNGNVVINYKTFFGFGKKNKQVSIDFKDGLIHGKLIFYEKNGKEYIISSFKNGIPDGKLIVICPNQDEYERNLFRPLEESLYEDGECIYRVVSPPPGTIKVYLSGYMSEMKKRGIVGKELLNKEYINSYLFSYYDMLESELENPLIDKRSKEDNIKKMEQISKYHLQITEDIIKIMKTFKSINP